MAKMYPYPVEQFNNPLEGNLYRKFEKQLDESYTVFYNRTWSRVKPNGNPDPECDFIIAQEGAGIILIELKGGRWERENGGWIVNKKRVPQKDNPIYQLLGNKNALIELLRSTSKWSKTWFPVTHALIFPDTVFPQGMYREGLPPILTYEDINYIPEWVASAMRDCVQINYPSRLSSEMMEYLKEILLRDYSMFLNDVLNINEKELLILTEQQLQLDRSLQRLRQITIQGCAGSGKTLFAIRQAKRLARTPNINNILFTCFNLELGGWLQKQTYDIRNRCRTIPFLSFCEKQLIHYGSLSGKEEKTREYYDELPYLLNEIIDLYDIKFDAIIVDEGQSFQNDWWIVLHQMLREPEISRFFIFYDDLQRIYDEIKNKVPGEDSAFDLTVNIRNTAKIHQQAVKFLPQDRLPDSNNITGEDVRLYYYANESEMKGHLRHSLDDLIRDGRVSSKDIVILSAKSSSSCLSDGEKIGPYTLRNIEINEPSAIRFTTIQRFRGMERRVVIMTELDSDIGNIEQLNYLGCSRTKSLLVLLVSKTIEPNLLNRITEGCVEKN